MSTLSLLKYGPFVVGECIPHTLWEVKEINWNYETNKVQIKLKKGDEVVIEESEYSLAAHKNTTVKHTKIADF